MRALILLGLIATGVASAQDADRRPLDPGLEGTWEMVAFDVPGGGIPFDTLLLSIDGNWVTQTSTYERDGQRQELSFTVECFTMDSRPRAGTLAGTAIENVISCLPSEDGVAGYGGLGQPHLEGDVLTLSMPDAGAGPTRVVLHRIQ
ncbi:hypothetical protein [Rubrivirga sp.]|uniref:hypothetical protein n=1 Tax=Rubrivirga sp. TaxID=1885344 RepID=UPI003C76F29D